MSVADQFKGLPIEVLIGGPLKAACEANVLMAQATANFIDDVGFDTEYDGDKVKKKTPRMVDFSFEKPGKDSEGKPTIELVKIDVPILAIVPIPNLQINNVDITFDMEVKSSTASKDSKDKRTNHDTKVKGGWGPVSASVSISGSVSSKSENTRSSDSSAKYHIEVNAQNFGIPEGLSRVLDMMNQAVNPSQIEQFSIDEKGERSETGILIDSEGNEIKKKAGGQ